MRDRLERFQKAGKQRRGEMEALSARLAAVQQQLAKAEQVNILRRLLGVVELRHVSSVASWAWVACRAVSVTNCRRSSC